MTGLGPPQQQPFKFIRQGLGGKFEKTFKFRGKIRRKQKVEGIGVKDTEGGSYPGGHELLTDELQGFFAGDLAFLEDPANSRGGHGRAWFFDTPHSHAKMFGLHDDENTLGFEDLHEGVSDLGRDTFLELGTAGNGLNDPRQFGKTGQSILLGDVGNVSLPIKGQEMMLAHGIKRDIPEDDHLIMALGRENRHYIPGVKTDAGKNFLIHFGDAFWGVFQSFPFRVLPNGQ